MMKIGVLGTGTVGEAIATALVGKGHTVKMGSRTNDNEKAAAWVERTGEKASQGTFDEAAGFGEILFICLSGHYALDVVSGLSSENVSGKTVIDLTNPLDFSQGMPPRMLDGYGNTTSLGEKVQEALPKAHVVKTLNTVNYKLMIDARVVNAGDHHLFLSGDHANAKEAAKAFLCENFYWKPDHIIDLGGIETARVVEAIVPFWVLLYRTMGSPLFNFKVVH